MGLDWIGGWMVIISHWSSKSTFGANNHTSNATQYHWHRPLDQWGIRKNGINVKLTTLPVPSWVAPSEYARQDVVSQLRGGWVSARDFPNIGWVGGLKAGDQWPGGLAQVAEEGSNSDQHRVVRAPTPPAGLKQSNLPKWLLVKSGLLSRLWQQQVCTKYLLEWPL